jgi:hypothetical protein
MMPLQRNVCAASAHLATLGDLHCPVNVQQDFVPVRADEVCAFELVGQRTAFQLLAQQHRLLQHWIVHTINLQ